MFVNDQFTQVLSLHKCVHPEQDIDLEVLSKSELVAINRVLMRMLDWTNPDEFVHNLYSELKKLFDVQECALYATTEDGTALRLKVNAGDDTTHLPDIIPHTSDLYCAIISGYRASAKTAQNKQLNLFDEWPDCIFRPIFWQSSFTACLALSHAAGNVDLLDIILTHAALVLARLWQKQTLQDRSPQSDASSSRLSRLTAREEEVLSLMADGLPNKQIADRLYISVATCKRHVENVLSKLGVHSRCAAVSIWLARLDFQNNQYKIPNTKSGSRHAQFGPY